VPSVSIPGLRASFSLMGAQIHQLPRPSQVFAVMREVQRALPAEPGHSPAGRASIQMLWCGKSCHSFNARS
jgi:hypothetical protein